MIRHRYRGTGFERWLASPPADAPAQLVALFRDMLRIRIIEEEIEKRYRQDEMKTPIHLVIGQEGSAVGCCAALEPRDLVYCGHRTHGAYLAKGGDLKAMLSEMHCRSNGCVGSRGGSMHLIDKKAGMAWSSAIVGGAVPIAAGAALAQKLAHRGRVVVVFMGEAATEEGAVSEAMNFAALKSLPIVFFCENNFYSVQSPLTTRQPERGLCRWAEGFSMPALHADGTCVLSVRDAVRQAVERARGGGGPTFVESEVYRFRAHGGAGDDSQTGYRDIEERRHWEAYCPVETFFRYLQARGLLTDAERSTMTVAIQREVADAFAHALASPHPTAADLARHVYSE